MSIQGVLMSEEWQKTELSAAAKILAEINQHVKPVAFTPDKTTLRAQSLPFFKEYKLYEMTDHAAVPAARKYALYKPGDVVMIDWTNGPIYATNEKAPIILNERSVIPYAKFFFNFVRGRKGRFQLIESIEDIRWQVEPPLQGRKVMQEMLEPIAIVEHNQDGGYRLDAFMLFKDSLFKTKISIDRLGLLTMSDEELKVEGLPVMQDAA